MVCDGENEMDLSMISPHKMSNCSPLSCYDPECPQRLGKFTLLDQEWEDPGPNRWTSSENTNMMKELYMVNLFCDHEIENDPFISSYAIDDCGLSEGPSAKKRVCRGLASNTCQRKPTGGPAALLDHSSYCVAREEIETPPVFSPPTDMMGNHFNNMMMIPYDTLVENVSENNTWVETIPKKQELPSDGDSGMNNSPSSSPGYTKNCDFAASTSCQKASDSKKKVSKRKREQSSASSSQTQSHVGDSSSNKGVCILSNPVLPGGVSLGDNGNKCVLTSVPSMNSGYTGNKCVLTSVPSTSSGYTGRNCVRTPVPSISSGHTGKKSNRKGKTGTAPNVCSPGTKKANNKNGNKKQKPVPLTVEEERKKLERNRQKALKEKQRRFRSKQQLEEVKKFVRVAFPKVLGEKAPHQQVIDKLLWLLPSVTNQVTIKESKCKKSEKYLSQRKNQRK